jgi:hypothetical protein
VDIGSVAEQLPANIRVFIFSVSLSHVKGTPPSVKMPAGLVGGSEIPTGSVRAGSKEGWPVPRADCSDGIPVGRGQGSSEASRSHTTGGSDGEPGPSPLGCSEASSTCCSEPLVGSAVAHKNGKGSYKVGSVVSHANGKDGSAVAHSKGTGGKADFVGEGEDGDGNAGKGVESPGVGPVYSPCVGPAVGAGVRGIWKNGTAVGAVYRPTTAGAGDARMAGNAGYGVALIVGENVGDKGRMMLGALGGNDGRSATTVGATERTDGSVVAAGLVGATERVDGCAVNSARFGATQQRSAV